MQLEYDIWGNSQSITASGLQPSCPILNISRDNISPLDILPFRASQGLRGSKHFQVLEYCHIFPEGEFSLCIPIHYICRGPSLIVTLTLAVQERTITYSTASYTLRISERIHFGLGKDWLKVDDRTYNICINRLFSTIPKSTSPNTRQVPLKPSNA